MELEDHSMLGVTVTGFLEMQVTVMQLFIMFMAKMVRHNEETTNLSYRGPITHETYNPNIMINRKIPFFNLY